MTNWLKFSALAISTTLLIACGGGGGGGVGVGESSAQTQTALTITGTAAIGLAIPGATTTGKCKVGSGNATTVTDGSYTLTIADGQLPCVLQITNPVDGIKLHTVATGSGRTVTANITPLTEMVTARVLGSEPNVFFAAFDASVAVQKITSSTVQAAQTDIGFVLTGTVETAALGNFITAPLKAATLSSPNSGDAHDTLLDLLKSKLTSTQIGTLVTALANNQTTNAVKQIVTSMKGGGISTPVAPLANAGAGQSVIAGTTVTLDASTSSATAGKSLTYAWTLISKPIGSNATLAEPTSVKPTFLTDLAGTYVASVIVNDGTTASSAAAVSVTAAVANAAPVANAGVAQNVVTGSVVTLDGSTSSDANGDALTYAWTLTAKPAGSSAALSSSTSPKPTLTTDLVGTYVASLTVNDGKSGSNIATVSVTAAVAADADITPPITLAVPAISFITQTALITQTINENGTGYYLVLPAASAAPTVSEVKAGTAFAMTGGTPATVSVTGLYSTEYKYYFVSKDSANNDQAAVSPGLYFLIEAVPAGFVFQGGLMWAPNTIRSQWPYYLLPNDSWSTANSFCNSTAINNQTGWRLPTKDELVSLSNSGAIGTGLKGWTGSSTWSSTYLRPTYYYFVQLSDGYASVSFEGYPKYVSCVR